MATRENTRKKTSPLIRELAASFKSFDRAIRKLGEAPSAPRDDAVNRVAWVAFLASHIRTEEDGLRLVNGHPLEETQNRTLYRWVSGESNPTFWAVDRFLVKIGLHIDDFQDFCKDNQVTMWATGKPPYWWDG